MQSRKTLATKSCIYRGQVSHRRFSPARNDFRYAQFMMYLDLAELDTLFDRFWFWSAKRWAPAWFRRRDHAGSSDQPLDESIRDLVERESGLRPSGPIRLLTHLRYSWHCFNPISIYYCFDTNEQLEAVVLEVSNTPWKEMRCYVLTDPERPDRDSRRYAFTKHLHVSPFMPMDIGYRCKLRAPDDKLLFSLENWREGARIFDAHLNLTRVPISSAALAETLLTDPLITLRVVSLIHWQAIRLWFKRVPFYPHPRKHQAPDETHALPNERTR